MILIDKQFELEEYEEVFINRLPANKLLEIKGFSKIIADFIVENGLIDVKSLTYINSNFFINSESLDLYIKMVDYEDSFFPVGTIVISRISFPGNERNKLGSKIYNMLKNEGKKYAYKYIAIEQTNSNSSAFAKAMGMAAHNNERNFIAEI